jgi:hypothetical protein
MVQRRRELPTRVIQAMQLAIQKRVIARVLAGSTTMQPPLLLRLTSRFGSLRRVFGHLLGLGIRREHVRTPAVA